MGAAKRGGMRQPEKGVGICVNGGDVFRLLLGMRLALSRQMSLLVERNTLTVLSRFGVMRNTI